MSEITDAAANADDKDEFNKSPYPFIAPFLLFFSMYKT